ncbi:MAG: hypothetical protein ABG776_13585, partial [Cyanobacteria bacterium J06555_13]
TLAWFSAQQADLGPLLTECQQLQPSWLHLMHLAEIFRETLAVQLSYADYLVEKYALADLIVPAICAWLERIDRHDTDSSDMETVEASVFQANSGLWQTLSPQKVEEIALTSPNLLTVLARELCRANRANAISGSVLHQLVAHWQNGHPIDSALLALLGDPAVVKTYTDEDWLAIARLCWSPNTQCSISTRPRALTSQRKLSLVNQAKEIVSTCDSPQWVEHIILDSSTWGLEVDTQQEILAIAKPNTCSITLIRRLLNGPNGTLELSLQPLVRLLSQTEPQSPEECQDYQQVLTAAVLHGLQISALPIWLQEPSAIARPDLYQTAVSNAFEQLMAKSVQALKAEHQRVRQAFPALEQRLDGALQKVLMTAFNGVV